MTSDLEVVFLEQPCQEQRHAGIDRSVCQLGMPDAEFTDERAEVLHRLPSPAAILLKAPEFIGEVFSAIPISFHDGAPFLPFTGSVGRVLFDNRSGILISQRISPFRWLGFCEHLSAGPSVPPG